MWCPACGGPCSARDAACKACGRILPRRHAPFSPCEAGRALAGYRLLPHGPGTHVQGETPAGLPTHGRRQGWRLEGPGAVSVDLTWVEWADGECEVRRAGGLEATGRGDPALRDPAYQDPALETSRLDVETWGEDGHRVVDLSVATFDVAGNLRFRDVSEYELCARTGTCVRCAMLAAGAFDVGTRQELLGLGDERRHALCAVLTKEARGAAVLAYVLTRILPLFRQQPRAPGAMRVRA